MKKLLATISLILSFALPMQAFAAISYVGAHGRNNGTGSTASLVIASGVGGTNGMLICSVMAEANGTTVSSATYGGSGMTQLGPYIDTDDGSQMLAAFYIMNPASSGTASFSLSGSTIWAVWCDSYSGVLQDGTAWGTPISNVGGPYNIGSPVDITRTSTSTGSWMFLTFKEDSAGTPLTISAGGTIRENGPKSGATIIEAHFDSDAGINNTSSNTMTINWTGGSQRAGYIAAMFAPALVATGGAEQELMIFSDD